MVNIFFDMEFEGGRYVRRVGKIVCVWLVFVVKSGVIVLIIGYCLFVLIGLFVR